MKQNKLLVVVGGQSTEHQISRMSGTSVVRELNRDRYILKVIGIDLDGQWYELAERQWADLTVANWLEGAQKVSDVYALLKSADVVFPVLHGLYGEDGTIQGLFELAKVPYVGNRVLGSALAMDKIYTKMIFERAGIPQTPSIYIKKRRDGRLVWVDEQFNESADLVSAVEEKIGFPCFLKPSNSGSSVGVCKANNASELMEKLALVAQYDRKIVVEKNINCIELETAVLGNDDPKVSAVGQIMPHGEFYTFSPEEDTSINIFISFSGIAMGFLLKLFCLTYSITRLFKSSCTSNA